MFIGKIEEALDWASCQRGHCSKNCDCRTDLLGTFIHTLQTGIAL